MSIQLVGLLVVKRLSMFFYPALSIAYQDSQGKSETFNSHSWTYEVKKTYYFQKKNPEMTPKQENSKLSENADVEAINFFVQKLHQFEGQQVCVLPY